MGCMMTLLDAPMHDAMRAKSRRTRWLTVACATAAIAIAAYLTWNLPAEHRINEFLTAVESRNFPLAFGIWNNDPSWQQHPQHYSAAGYSYGRFLSDWGPNSDYGTIARHKIVHATSLYGNTTMVVVDINNRPASLLTIAVENHAHALTFPPFGLTPVENGFGWKTWQISYR